VHREQQKFVKTYNSTLIKHEHSHTSCLFFSIFCKIGLGTMDTLTPFRDQVLETAFYEWIIQSPANITPTELAEEYTRIFRPLGWTRYDNAYNLARFRVQAKLQRRRSLQRKVESFRESASRYEHAGMRLRPNEKLAEYATRILLGERPDTEMKDATTETEPMETETNEPSVPDGYEIRKE
jgi:hypothetical protein